MAQLFDDEILSVVLKFTNPNRQDMLDADKVASRLSLSLDSVVRRAVSAGKAVGEIFDDIKKLEPALKKLEQRSGLIQGQAHALRSAQQILTRYTPARLEKMAEVQASKIAETSGTAALRRQLEKHGDLIKRLVATQEGRYERATRGSSTGRAIRKYPWAGMMPKNLVEVAELKSVLSEPDFVFLPNLNPSKITGVSVGLKSSTNSSLLLAPAV